MPGRTKGKSTKSSAGTTKVAAGSRKSATRSRKSPAGTTQQAGPSKRVARNRSVGTRLRELGKSPLAQEMAAAAVVAVAGVLVRNKKVRSGAEKLGESARDAATGTVGIAKEVASKVGGAIRRTRADHDEDRVPTRQPSRPKPPKGEMPYIS